MRDITLSTASKRPVLSAVSAFAIAIALAGCASWHTCAAKLADADLLLELASTGDEAANAGAGGLWLVGRLGCVTRESLRAAPPPAAPVTPPALPPPTP